MALIRIKKADIYIAKKSDDNQPLVKLFNTILEIDKLTNKNKLVGFSVDKGNPSFDMYSDKNLERIDVIDTDEGRTFTLSNTVMEYDQKNNSVTITAEKAEEM